MRFLPHSRLTPPPPPVAGAVWIPLTKAKFALVDVTDAEAVSRHTWSFDGMYPAATINSHRVRLHRFLLGRGAQSIDHANSDKLDNRRANLRPATFKQNMANMKHSARNSSGFKGVIWIEKCKHWRAQIGINGMCGTLGHFSDPIEAACAYNKAAKARAGAFARLNRMD